MVSLAAPFFVVCLGDTFPYRVVRQCSIASADISFEPPSDPPNVEGYHEDFQICYGAVSGRTSHEEYIQEATGLTVNA